MLENFGQTGRRRPSPSLGRRFPLIAGRHLHNRATRSYPWRASNPQTRTAAQPRERSGCRTSLCGLGRRRRRCAATNLRLTPHWLQPPVFLRGGLEVQVGLR